jgi:hypothetical protein
VSGSIGLNLVPVTIGVDPTEGSKVAGFNIKWALTVPFGTYNVNLLQQYQTNQFVTVQAIYVDNSTCPYQVKILNQQTGQTIYIPPFTVGMYPILTGTNPSFICTLFYVNDQAAGTYLSAVTTRLYFLNSKQDSYVATTPIYGNAFFNYSVNTPLAAGANEFQAILPAPGQATSHYIINSISLFVGTSSSVLQNVVVSIVEQGSSSFNNPLAANSYGRAYFVLPIPANQFASNNFQINFPIPVLCFNANNGLGFTLSGYTGNVNIGITISYGVIDIE